MALKIYESKKELSYALTTNLVINSLLVFDFFWFENYFPTTFEAMYEGVGCLFVLKYFLYPFFTLLITKNIIIHNLEIPLWNVVLTGFLFVTGYIVHRASNLQKAVFRKNPLNPALSREYPPLFFFL